MLMVQLDEAREGMRLATPVAHPEKPGHDLLKAGFALTGDVIERLGTVGVTSVFVDYPELAELDRFMDPYLSPARQVVYRQVRDTMAAAQKSTRPTVAFPDYYAATRELIITLMHGGQHPVYLDLMARQMGDEAVAHAVAVSHLSLVLGIRLEEYLVRQRSRLAARHAREVVNLGVAGMLHDIGAARLSEPARRATRVDAPADDAVRAEWESHPRIGYEMVKGGVEASAAAAVLHHHQHWDGSGFPGLPADPCERAQPGQPSRNAGERIHVFARIVAAADLFDRLTTNPATGERRPTIEALHLMRTQHAGWVDPVILARMPSAVPPFPPGLKVRLSDGTVAVTVNVNLDRPYRPTVRRVVVQDEQFRLAKESTDLASRENTGLRITHLGKTNVEAWVPAEVAPVAVRKTA